MHNKLKLHYLSLSFGLIFLFSPLLHAQSIFNFKAPPTTNAPAAPGAPQVNQVMSPNEFQNTVNQLGKQNLNELSEQVTQQIAKSPPLPNKNASTTSPSPGSSKPASPPPSSTISPPAEAKPGANEVYTGFNFDNTNTGGATGPANPSPTDTGGGWNIKY